MTIMEYLQSLSLEDRVALVGCADNALRGLRNCTERTAANSFLSWACPEYLAGQLGFAFECQSPASNSDKRCERCAAAFLKMQMPNTGRAKKWKQ